MTVGSVAMASGQLGLKQGPVDSLVCSKGPMDSWACSPVGSWVCSKGQWTVGSESKGQLTVGCVARAVGQLGQ